MSRYPVLVPRISCSIIFSKAYPTVDPHNAKFVTTLGKICSGIERLPTSAVLSAGLKKHHTISIASGGFTDVWQGGYHSAPVAIKSFRIYPAENLKEAKEVSIWLTLEIRYRTKFVDFVETGADVEKAIP